MSLSCRQVQPANCQPAKPLNCQSSRPESLYFQDPVLVPPALAYPTMDLLGSHSVTWPAAYPPWWCPSHAVCFQSGFISALASNTDAELRNLRWTQECLREEVEELRREVSLLKGLVSHRDGERAKVTQSTEQANQDKKSKQRKSKSTSQHGAKAQKEQPVSDNLSLADREQRVQLKLATGELHCDSLRQAVSEHRGSADKDFRRDLRIAASILAITAKTSADQEKQFSEFKKSLARVCNELDLGHAETTSVRAAFLLAAGRRVGCSGAQPRSDILQGASPALLPQA